MLSIAREQPLPLHLLLVYLYLFVSGVLGLNPELFLWQMGLRLAKPVNIDSVDSKHGEDGVRLREVIANHLTQARQVMSILNPCFRAVALYSGQS